MTETASTTQKSKKRRVFAAVTAVVLSLAIMLSATLAWTSISQTALNEVSGEVNPGGRLHDDFDGENKDVYVENYGESNIYVRIRLDEYLEIGEGAGTGTGSATSIVAGAELDDKTTWTTYIYGEDSAFRDYYELVFGGEGEEDGSKIYMPTFNKDNTSLEADINGTYANNYEDYVTYTEDEQKTDNAVYDASTTVQETHTAQSTLTATVITMVEWQALGSPVGPYWVYDTDGWAYWAEALAPGEATGLLLDKIIKINDDIPEDWYYAINVVAQFATANDIGFDSTDTGFYDITNGAAPTADAEELLKLISGYTEATLPEWAEELKSLVDEYGVGTTNTVEIDGREWYVLAHDTTEGDRYLLWAKEMETTFGTNGEGLFDGIMGNDSIGDNVWETSSVRTWLNGTYINSLTELSQYAINTEITTRSEYNATTWITTTDTVFLLSEADVAGTFNREATTEAQDYTYNGTQLVTNSELLFCDNNIDITESYWLRSPMFTTTGVASVAASTGLVHVTFYYNHPNRGLRPALWIDLAS